MIVADGAAFESQMNRIERLVKSNKLLHLYLPESFEWLLLQSGIFKNAEIKDMLMHVADYVESRDYFSWEQFFSDYITRISQGSYLQYSKKRLNENYLQGAVKKQILEAMKGISVEELTD